MSTLVAVKKPRQLRKRDQSYAPFDAQKILHAITAAGRATGEFDPATAAQLCQHVLKTYPSMTRSTLKTFKIVSKPL